MSPAAPGPGGDRGSSWQGGALHEDAVGSTVRNRSGALQDALTRVLYRYRNHGRSESAGPSAVPPQPMSASWDRRMVFREFSILRSQDADIALDGGSGGTWQNRCPATVDPCQSDLRTSASPSATWTPPSPSSPTSGSASWAPTRSAGSGRTRPSGSTAITPGSRCSAPRTGTDASSCSSTFTPRRSRPGRPSRTRSGCTALPYRSMTWTPLSRSRPDTGVCRCAGWPTTRASTG